MKSDATSLQPCWQYQPINSTDYFDPAHLAGYGWLFVGVCFGMLLLSVALYFTRWMRAEFASHDGDDHESAA